MERVSYLFPWNCCGNEAQRAENNALLYFTSGLYIGSMKGTRLNLGAFASLTGLYELKMEIFRRLRMDLLCEILEEKTFIRPDHITVFNFLLGGVGLLLLFKYPLGFSMLLIVHFFLDNLDGYYARTRKVQTIYGRYIDHVVDFILGVLYLSVSASYFGEPWMWILLVMFCGEMLLLLGMGEAENKFPSRIFLIFYVFGWYRLGLFIQAFQQPLAFLGFWISRRVRGNKEEIGGGSGIRTRDIL